MAEWRALLDWEEGIFRALLRGWQWVSPESVSRSTSSASALFDSEVRALTVLAQALSAEPVRLRVARGAGGVRGAELLLPAQVDLAPELAGNREAYRVQAVVASGVRLLTRGLEAPAPNSFESALESLRVAHEAVGLMCDELAEFRGVYERVITRVIAARSVVDTTRMSTREAELELARRAALAGEHVWKDRALCSRLTGARQGRRLSPELPIWGTWLPAVGEAALGAAPPGSESPTEPATELDAPEVDVLRRIDLDNGEDSEQSVPVAPFERAESLDSYQGGKRDLDGADELEAHLDALEQVDLGELFRGPGASQSILKADLELGVEIADAAEGDRRKGIRYDEWDGRKRVYRRNWCTVFPSRAGEGPAAWAEDRLHQHRDLVRVLRQRLEAQRSGLRAAPRQLDGEDIDLDAAIDDRVAQLAGLGSSPRVYQRQQRRRRDFATTLLLDVSMSTDSWVDGRRVLDVSREAALVLGAVADQLGDRIQVLGFASETRNRCLVWEALHFGGDWSVGKSRIAGLRPQGYTRIGPALRHATAMLAKEMAEQRLLLLISDGKPTDYDRYEGRYGIGDVRMALREAERLGIHAHALAIDSCARDYLPALFGESGWHILPRPDDLVEALTEVYGRLTAR